MKRGRIAALWGRRGSWVGIVFVLWAGRPRNRVSIPRRDERLSVSQNVKRGTGSLSASYLMGTGGPFPGVKAAEAWSSQPASIKCRSSEWVGLYLHSACGWMTCWLIRPWVLTQRAGFRSQASPYWICGGQTGTEPDFSTSTAVSLCYYSVSSWYSFTHSVTDGAISLIGRVFEQHTEV